MTSDVGIGDIEIPFLDVNPGDGTTSGTLTVTAPDGTESSPTVTPGTPDAGKVRLTAAAVTYTAAGRWVLHWEVTNTGAGAEDQEVYVVASPVAGGPKWTPGRSRVANYVPGRTLARDSETHELTFDSRTLPTGVQVDRLIADAVSWVRLLTGDVDATLHDAAAVAAAIRAACAVERGYPAEQDEQSLERARDLCEQATRARKDLARANEAATGIDTTDPAAGLLPQWSFPEPVAWGDRNFPLC